MRTLSEKIAVMKAADRGCDIEIITLLDIHRGKEENWTHVARPSFNWADFDYRIKPDTTTLLYINEFRFKGMSNYTLHHTGEDADRYADGVIGSTNKNFVKRYTINLDKL